MQPLNSIRCIVFIMQWCAIENYVYSLPFESYPIAEWGRRTGVLSSNCIVVDVRNSICKENKYPIKSECSYVILLVTNDNNSHWSCV